MLLDNYKKQSPIVGVAGLGGGINSYIFLSPGGDYVISKSLRFNSADSSRLSRTFSAGNRKVFTISLWAKKSQIGTTYEDLFNCDVGGQFRFIWEPNGNLELYSQNGSTTTFHIDTVALFRDPSAWYHFVVSVDAANTSVKFYVNGVELTDFVVHTAVQNLDTMVNSAALHTIGSKGVGQYFNGYLADVNFVDGQALAATNFGKFDDDGVWQPKKFSGGYGTNGFHLDFKDNSSIAALGADTSGNNNTWTVDNLTAAASASSYGIAFDGNDKVTFPGMELGTGNLTFECFFKMDSGTSGFRRILSRTDGGAGEDMIIRVHTNGYMQWYFDNQELTGSTTVTAGVWHHSAIVRSGSTVSYYYDGTRIGTDTSSADMTLNAVILAWGNGSEYFTGQIYGARITKQALYTGASYTVPTSAITTTSQGASSSNVVHLSATTSTTTTNSGTTGNGTANSDPTAIATYPFGGEASDVDSLIDSPSQNVADQTDSGLGGEITGNYATYNPVRPGSGTKSNGALTVTGTGQVPDVTSIAPNSGKWYAEIKWDSGSYARVGLQDVNIATSDFGGVAGQSYRYESNSGNVQPGGQTYSTYAAGDIIGVAFDCDAGKLWLAKNGTWQNSGNPAGGTGAVATNLIPGKHYAPANSSGSGSSVFTLNAGQRAFAYTAPSGFKCLTVENLPESTIVDGSKYFDTKLYSGNGGTQSITMDNSELSPDFVWIKCRNDAIEHQLFDSVRGALKSFRSDNDSVEATVANSLTSFDSNGFSLGSSTVVNHTKNYAAWAWDAGNGNNTYAITVANPGSGNKYYIDGVLGTTLTLAEGSTYKFDQSNSSNSGHPLRFSTTNNGTHGGGTEYTTGVTTVGTPGSAGAYTQIVIAAGAPTLYVYCSVHSGMGFQINTSDTGGYTIPVGSLNSSAYNQSAVWSGMCSPTPSSGTFANGFDGSLTTTFAGGISAGAYFTFTPTGGISFSNNIRVYNGAVSGASYKYNGGSATSFPTNSWTTVASGGGTMTTFAVTRSDTDVHGWYAIEVDGKLLVDSNATPPNVPSITSQVMSSPESGFSIVTYDSDPTGTVGHGLNTKPSLIIERKVNTTGSWVVTTDIVDGTLDYLYLNTTAAKGNATINSPTSSVFTPNASNNSMIAYCFSPIAGYSAMGSYIGNGSAEGMYIYTGFAPSWLLFKRSDSTSDWSIYDTARDPHNVAGDKLEPNTTDTESAEGAVVDILSNGFKFRRNSLENGGNDVYIYMAFAEHPFNSSRAR